MAGKARGYVGVIGWMSAKAKYVDKICDWWRIQGFEPYPLLTGCTQHSRTPFISRLDALRLRPDVTRSIKIVWLVTGPPDLFFPTWRGKPTGECAPPPALTMRENLYCTYDVGP